MTSKRPIAKEVSAWLEYNCEDGLLRWKRSPNRRLSVGTIAGTLNSAGRYQVRVCGVSYLSARVCWFLSRGVQPLGEIDHINGDPTDNRLSNLRDITRLENAQNRRRATKASRSGVLGVTQVPSGMYVARINHAGKTKYLGTYGCQNSAFSAYVEEKRRLHKGCTL